ncbi:Pentatricopeptide repeat [Parasponia andersonii]|uniref:Pentatricopeptide repeat n=1 Tax=Parasponia andersonii TaxID=3476 RepID=A0A2P5DQQ2_PARAD|nr:Pentatricopeptide repeat [Parasponia andersonii]
MVKKCECKCACYCLLLIKSGVPQRNPPRAAKRVVSRALTTQSDRHGSDSGAVKLSEEDDVELLYQSIQHGSSPNPQNLSELVSLCAIMASLDMGIQIHAAIFKLGFCSDVYICSALVNMYVKCGTMPDAQEADCPEMAIGFFQKMLKEGLVPTLFSLSGALVGCSQLGAQELGTQVHCLSLKIGSCYIVVVGTGFIDMYSSRWNLDDSRRVFDEMPDKNVITWSSMVTGYALNEQPDKAMILVRDMLRLDLKPTCVTCNSMLSSLSGPDFWDHCRQIHCQIFKIGFEFNGYVAVTLVTTYSRCNSSLKDFDKLCSCVTIWDNISWNAVIAGFSNLGIDKQALKCFSEMRKTGVNVNICTLASVLRAISTMSALEEGNQIHSCLQDSAWIKFISPKWACFHVCKMRCHR